VLVSVSEWQALGLTDSYLIRVGIFGCLHANLAGGSTNESRSERVLVADSRGRVLGLGLESWGSLGIAVMGRGYGIGQNENPPGYSPPNATISHLESDCDSRIFGIVSRDKTIIHLIKRHSFIHSVSWMHSLRR
jgi:hypothetical protein